MPITKRPKKADTRKPAAKSAKPQKARKPARLPKSEGDAGVQAYIASLEPWQAAVARRVDALVVKLVPGVRKAVMWHSPMYGTEERGVFLTFAAYQYHVNFSFIRGTMLKPVPPSGTQKTARALHVREPDTFDEEQWVSWIKQASVIHGWIPGQPL